MPTCQADWRGSSFARVHPQRKWIPAWSPQGSGGSSGSTTNLVAGGVDVGKGLGRSGAPGLHGETAVKRRPVLPRVNQHPRLQFLGAQEAPRSQPTDAAAGAWKKGGMMDI